MKVSKVGIKIDLNPDHMLRHYALSGMSNQAIKAMYLKGRISDQELLHYSLMNLCKRRK